MAMDNEGMSRPPRHGAGRSRRRRRKSPGIPGPVLEQRLVQALGQSEVPLSAYQLASDLRDAGYGVPVMSVYRALDRLIERERVEKVETLSAFRLHDKRAAALLICVDCGTTTSLAMPSDYANIVRQLPEASFDMRTLAIEATGRCAACRSSQDKSDRTPAPRPSLPDRSR